MRVAPEVSEKKFRLEIKRLDKQKNFLQKKGCWLVNNAFPYVDLMFVSHHKLKLSLPTQTSNILVYPQGVTPPQQYRTVVLPPLASRAFGARIALDDYDQRAPSVLFCDPFTWEPLPYDDLFRANHVDENNKPFSVVLGDHPVTHRPFLCMRGIREYHEHPQHTGDDWMLYRNDYSLFDVIMTILRTCIEGAAPNLILTSPNNIQIRWEVNL